MLGWKIYIKKEPDNLIASWQVGLGGLAWIDELIKAGLIKDLGGNGYPNKYSARAEVILPKIYPNPPEHMNSIPVMGDDYILSGNDTWDVKFEEVEIMKCRSEDTLMIEAWDMS